jgi:diacylglycerol kinase family enzyme
LLAIAKRAPSLTFAAAMRVIVLTNPKAGQRADELEALRSALAAAGVAVADVREVPGGQLTAAARRAAVEEKPDALVAAGGDGTASAVANAVRDTGVPMGVIPSGTLNHFAKDLGLPLKVDQAARVIAAGHVAAVDVGVVNDRHAFVNNASIGLYPRFVDKRDTQRQRLGRRKWPAMLLALLSVFRRYPTVRVRIGVEDRSILRTTPFVFVGNNKYEVNLTMLGKRQRVDAGELCVYFANRTGRFGLFRLALRAVLGRLEQARDFDALMVREMWIETPKREVRVALDGEVVRLKPPLHFVSRPKSLRVLAPASDAAAIDAPQDATRRTSPSPQAGRGSDTDPPGATGGSAAASAAGAAP